MINCLYFQSGSGNNRPVPNTDYKAECMMYDYIIIVFQTDMYMHAKSLKGHTTWLQKMFDRKIFLFIPEILFTTEICCLFHLFSTMGIF